MVYFDWILFVKVFYVAVWGSITGVLMRGIFKLFDVVQATQIFYTVIILLFCLNIILGLMEAHLSCLIYSDSLILCGLFFR